MNNTDIKSQFNPFYMDKNSDSTNVGYDLYTDFLAFNHVRTVGSNMGEGSYNVTDTWTVSEHSQPATHDIEISLDADIEARGNSVTVSGSIQGLSTTNPSNGNKEDKYTNALSALATVLQKAYDAANAVYLSSGLSLALRTPQKGKSVGHGKTSGTITFSVTFDDIPVTTPGAVKEDINITYDNWDGSNQVIAIIGVIDNSGGPVIQDMGTTTEKKISVSVDITMDQNNRTSRPDGTTLALAYVSSDIINKFRQSKSETWNPLTGIYNFSVAYTGSAEPVLIGPTSPPIIIS